jgi:hypothetical protein
MSPWYHDSPNGASGTWITNRSNSVRAGRPATLTRIVSVSPLAVTVADPCASLKQPAASAPLERTILKRI